MVAGVQDGPYDLMYGVSFIGDYGTIKASRSSYKLIPEYYSENKKAWTEALEVKGGKESHDKHVRNFLDSVKSRAIPACPPEVGRVAAIHVHAANIDARIGEPYLVWDDKNNRFTNSEKANSFIVPDYRAPWTLPKFN